MSEANQLPYGRATCVWTKSTKTASANIFNGENFTRAEFFASALPVPEPDAYAMMLAGLGMIGFAARRRLQNIRQSA